MVRTGNQEAEDQVIKDNPTSADGDGITECPGLGDEKYFPLLIDHLQESSAYASVIEGLSSFAMRYVCVPTACLSSIQTLAIPGHLMDARSVVFNCIPTEKLHPTLKLVVNRMTFDNYLNGDKRAEMCKPSDRNMSLLYHRGPSGALDKRKSHQLVEIRDGYGKARPFFTAEVSEYRREVVNILYLSGLHVNGLFK